MRFQHVAMPSGLHNCWRLWRHCCCRYGLYTAAVAPVATAGFLLSIFSSVGCRFVNVHIGFTPSNPAMNASQTEIGLFLHYMPEVETDYENKYRDWIHEHCVTYSSVFEEAFVEHDRTWKIARVMAMVAAGSGGLAAVVSWLIVLTPVPASCLWPGVLLPAVMMAFISEGSKFLFFDNAMCRSNIWYPSGVDSLPTSAESCSLGPSAIFAIAAGAVHLTTLLMVCLKAPELRELDPDFGVLYTTGAEMDLEEAKQETREPPPSRGGSHSSSSGGPGPYNASNVVLVSSGSDRSSNLQPTCESSISDVYTHGNPEDVSTIGDSQTSHTTSQATPPPPPPPTPASLKQRSSVAGGAMTTTSSLTTSTLSSSTMTRRRRSKTPPPPLPPPLSSHHHQHHHHHHHPLIHHSSSLPDVSSSRLSALSKAQQSAREAASPDALVAQLVSDLDHSFMEGPTTTTLG